jgi:hypothetical protein
LELEHFLPPPIRIDFQDCTVHHEFPKPLQKPMENFVDVFLYLGPQDLRRMEKIPADVVLDAAYKVELQKGGDMLGFPEAANETPQRFDQQIVDAARSPLFVIPKPPDPKLPDPELARQVQGCLERKAHGKPPQ